MSHHISHIEHILQNKSYAIAEWYKFGQQDLKLADPDVKTNFTQCSIQLKSRR